MKKDLKIEFAPGAFDDFEGTQEELESLIDEISRLIESGEIFLEAEPLDEDDPLWETINQKKQRH